MFFTVLIVTVVDVADTKYNRKSEWWRLNENAAVYSIAEMNFNNYISTYFCQVFSVKLKKLGNLFVVIEKAILLPGINHMLLDKYIGNICRYICWSINSTGRFLSRNQRSWFWSLLAISSRKWWKHEWRPEYNMIIQSG